MAPLYNLAPIVPEVKQADRQDRRTDGVASCMELLRLIDNILRAFEIQKPPVVQRMTVGPSTYAKWAYPIASLVMLTVSAGMSIHTRLVYRACKTANDTACDRLYGDDLCASDVFGTSTACTLESQVTVVGIEVWRILLFLSLFWPLSILSKVLAVIMTSIVRMHLVGDLVVFIVFGTRRQFEAFLCALVWFCLWFPITERARVLADASETWNSYGPYVWTDRFNAVHFYVWRVLLLYVLFAFCSLVAAAAGRGLSLMFHHDDHFDRIKTYMANEKIIQLLTQPCHVPNCLSIAVGAKGTISMSGFECSHWPALLFVTRLVEGHLRFEGEAGDDLYQTATAMQRKLAKGIAKHYRSNRTIPTNDSWPDTTRGVQRGDAVEVPMLMDDNQSITQMIIDKARESLARDRSGANRAGGGGSDSSSRSSSSSGSEDGWRAWAKDWAFQRASDGRSSGSNTRARKFSRWIATLCKSLVTCDVSAADKNSEILDMRKYIASHRTPRHFRNDGDDGDGSDSSDSESESALDVCAGEGDSLGDSVMLGHSTQVHTWKLGYYLFWNLRHAGRDDPGLSRSDVYAVAHKINMPARTAWLLMDHNSDQQVTMDEVIKSVEQVYNDRVVLAKSLSESQTVVGQVQRIIHLFLLIVLAFVAVAVLVPGSISKVWTSMSAGLLSFSFIFGNSIREVFENCVFLFGTHPFDLGDKIRWQGETYFIRGITLNYVNLLHSSGAYVNLAAHTLKDEAITNVTRSQRVWESIHFAADINTTVRQCELAADKVVQAIATHPRLFGGMYRVWLSDTESANKIKISAHFDLKTNGMDGSMMGEAMTVMTAAFAEGLCKAGISYTDLALACPTCWPRASESGPAPVPVKQSN